MEVDGKYADKQLCHFNTLDSIRYLVIVKYTEVSLAYKPDMVNLLYNQQPWAFI